MKTALLAILFSAVMLGQPLITGTRPQIRVGNTLYNVGTVNSSTGSGAPGTIAGSIQGDFYLDTTANNTYQCFAAGPCTAVAPGNWVLIGSSSGGFTNLVVSTLQVTSPAFNAAAITGGITVGGDIGLTGGLTAGGGLTVNGNSSLTNLQINSNSTAALHIPNGGITIDAGFAPTSIFAAGNIVTSSTLQGGTLQVNTTSTFGGNMNVNGQGTFTASVQAAGVVSTGGITAAANISTSAGQVRVAGAHVVLDPSGSISWANGAGNLDASGNVNGSNAGFSGTVTSPNFFSSTGNWKMSGDQIIMNRALTGNVQTIAWQVGNSANAVGAFSIGSNSAGNLDILRGTGSASVTVGRFYTSGEVLLGVNGGNTIDISNSTGFTVNSPSSFSFSMGLSPGASLQNIRTNSTSVQQLQWCVTGVTCDPTAIGGWTWGTDGSNRMVLQAGQGGSSLLDVLHVDSSGTMTVPGRVIASGVTASGTSVANTFQNLSMITSCSGRPTGTFYNTTTSATGGGTVVGVCP